MKQIKAILFTCLYVSCFISIRAYTFPRNTENVGALLESSKASDRLKAARLLCKQPDNTFLSSLIRLVTDLDDKIKTAAAAALFNLAEHQHVPETFPDIQVGEIGLIIESSFVSSKDGKVEGGYQSRIIENKKKYFTVYVSEGTMASNEWNSFVLENLYEAVRDFLLNQNIKVCANKCRYTIMMIYQRAILDELGLRQATQYEHKIYRFLIDNDAKNIISFQQWIRYQDFPNTYPPAVGKSPILNINGLCQEAIDHLFRAIHTINETRPESQI
jgi:hypothetical protein